MKLLSACTALFLLVSILVVPFNGNAQSLADIKDVTGGQINEATLQTVPIRFLPNHPLYFLIRVKESFARFFKPSASERAEFDFILSGKRLKESYMLSANGDLVEAGKNLNRYSSRLGKMGEQIEKARSQNQDIAKQVDLISEGLKNHETFLAYLSNKEGTGAEVKGAISAFKEAVLTINVLRPGIKDRFKILLISDDKLNTNPATVSPESSELPVGIEATSSILPKRIIY